MIFSKLGRSLSRSSRTKNLINGCLNNGRSVLIDGGVLRGPYVHKLDSNLGTFRSYLAAIVANNKGTLSDAKYVLGNPRLCRFLSSETPKKKNSENFYPKGKKENPKESEGGEQESDSKDLKSRIEKFFKGDVEAFPSILEAIWARKLSGKHEDTDDELMDELRLAPLKNVEDAKVDQGFDDAYGDEDMQLYNAKDIVIKELMRDKYFNMDDQKWNAIMDEAKENGFIDDPKECEEILEDMLYSDKLLPEDIKQNVQAKYDELTEKINNNELEVEQAYEQFKVFEDEIVAEHVKKVEEERLLPESDEVAKPVDNKSDDPPGEGPILRWQSRLVFVPGGDAWHPKNRKVKLFVTVKELGLSKYQFRRMREIVGKRYHPGKDELTITSERFEHREENRKDCLRTLLNIIEEAGKANALVDEARTAYVKQRLKANPAFMARLHAKTKQAPTAVPA